MHDCSFGEDEYMCTHSSDSDSDAANMFYRHKKELEIQTTKQELQLPQFSIDTNGMKEIDHIVSTPQVTSTQSNSFKQIPSPIAYWCNRGVGIYSYDKSIVCFCPPQYYGEKCQYHADRLTVLLHLNLSQSIYAQSDSHTTVLKLLVIFMYEDQPLITDSFHVRPAIEMTVYKKKIHHLLYSRSKNLLHHKRARYFNRSDIINEHPYSVRIEAYELNINEKPQCVAVWQYPIYFDFLPSFRLAKVLQLTMPDSAENPCTSNPCSIQEECHPLLNAKSRYICLCRPHFTGKRCSIMDQRCSDNFCSANALCKPNYRGLLSGNELPYCICSVNEIGRRCNLVQDQCNPNPCQNNGTCFAKSEPNQFMGLCARPYYGKLCELGKQTVQLYIYESVEHKAAVIQYFHINLHSLDLILDHQVRYAKLPNFLHDQHYVVKPEIIVIKLFSESQVTIYLILVQSNAESINKTIQVNEKNQCAHVDTLFEGEGMSLN
jgi:hypothetical protein